MNKRTSRNVLFVAMKRESGFAIPVGRVLSDNGCSSSQVPIIEKRGLSFINVGQA